MLSHDYFRGRVYFGTLRVRSFTVAFAGVQAVPLTPDLTRVAISDFEDGFRVDGKLD